MTSKIVPIKSETIETPPPKQGPNNVKVFVRGAYDLQMLRIQLGNRICANFRHKLGFEESQAEEDAETEEQKNGVQILKELRKRYDRITDGVVKLNTKEFKGDEVISSLTEFALISEYFEVDKVEKKHFAQLGKLLEEYPVYTQFLQGVRGVGPAMAGVIISEINIHKARYPSSLVKYAGLDCGPDGAGRSKRKEHMITVGYKDKKGKDQEKLSITFNPFLKTKLLGVLAPSFIKSASPYADVYRNYKHRIENHPTHKDKTKKHRHNMAMRYMMRIFLIDLYKAWRPLEGLEVAPPYEEAKLGLKHQKVA